VAQLVQQRPVQDLLPRLEALRGSLPRQSRSGVEVMRQLRDGERL
jgi:hypothetical protein